MIICNQCWNPVLTETMLQHYKRSHKDKYRELKNQGLLR